MVKETVFPVKVYASKNRKGKDYFVYKVTIPKKVAKELKIKKDDHLLLKASKAEWFHLLDWGEMQSTWAMLPEHMKTRIRESGLKVPELQVPLPTSSLLPTPTTAIRQRSLPRLFAEQHKIVGENVSAVATEVIRERKLPTNLRLHHEKRPNLITKIPMHNPSQSLYVHVSPHHGSNPAAVEHYIQ